MATKKHKKSQLSCRSQVPRAPSWSKFDPAALPWRSSAENPASCADTVFVFGATTAAAKDESPLTSSYSVSMTSRCVLKGKGECKLKPSLHFSAPDNLPRLHVVRRGVL